MHTKEKVIAFYKEHPDQLERLPEDWREDFQMMVDGVPFTEIGRIRGRTGNRIQERLKQAARVANRRVNGRNWWDRLDVTERTKNAIAHAQNGRPEYATKEAFIDYISTAAGQAEMLKVPNMGKKSLNDLLDALGVERSRQRVIRCPSCGAIQKLSAKAVEESING
jgi:hypothetical protein